MHRDGRVIRSTNGEDVLYVFHARDDGRSLLLRYNVIRKEVANPIVCHGFSLFDDGTLVVFRATSEEPTRVHPMQVWQTPYLSDSYAAAQPVGTGPLERVGNPDLVRGISDCMSIARMVDEMSPAVAVFEALIAACARVFDHYHWLGERELGDLREPLAEVRSTGQQVLDEFEKVQSLTAHATATLDEAAGQIASLVRRVRGEAPLTAESGDRLPGTRRRVRRKPRRGGPAGRRRRLDRHGRRRDRGAAAAHRAGRGAAGGDRGGRLVGDRRRHRADRDPVPGRRGARRREPGPGHPGRAPPRTVGGGGPGRVRGRVRPARPGGDRGVGGGRHRRALRRAVGSAAAAGREP